MKRLRAHRRFFAFLGVLSLIAVAVTWGTVALYASTQRLSRRLDRASRELRATSERAIPAGAANARRDDDELERGRKILAELVGRLGRAETNAATGIGRSDMFFDVANFVEETRAEAMRLNVRVKLDEQFGFAAVVHDPSAASDIAAVESDIANLRATLGSIFSAQPTELISVEREIRTKAGSAPRQSPESKGFFAIDPRRTLRTAGEIETAAYRVSFSGRTSVLRDVLNSLAEGERPLVVRAVEVAAPLSPHAATAGSGGESAPFVANGVSKFTLVVEAVSLAGSSIVTRRDK